MHNERRENGKRRLAFLGLFGGAATGLGGLGAFGVCHSICTATIAALAAIGITGVALPFTFLENRWFINISLAIGVVSVLGAFVLWVRMRRHAPVGTTNHVCASHQSPPSERPPCCSSE